jgi:hypothetical protein
MLNAKFFLKQLGTETIYSHSVVRPATIVHHTFKPKINIELIEVYNLRTGEGQPLLEEFGHFMG